MTRLLVGVAVLAAAVVGLPATASGAQVTVTGVLAAGSLALDSTATPSFSATPSTTATYTIPSKVTDTTGSGAGWNTTITSTVFDTGTNQLPTTASKITSVGNTCATGQTCTAASNSVAANVVVPAAAGTAPTPIKYYNAALNTGMGIFNHTPTVAVTIPGSAALGAYSSTVTVAIVSGP